MSQRTRTLGGRYEVEETIGRGGMAEVFRARDRILGRTVAIKLLAERYSSDATFVTRFRREAQAAAGLTHPNVVSIFDTGSDDGQHYIVMELVEGRTLADLLAEEGTVVPERAAAIAASVSAALAEAHDRGLVHRDVKPANIMLTTGDRVKVMDFGIARTVADDTLTQTGTVLGTAAYLSPEQAQGHPVDPRSDVYSLGCVLYEMLAGRPPFVGDSPVSIAYKHVGDAPVAPSSLRRGIPGALEEIVLQCLSKDPDDRFASGRELQEALEDTGAEVAGPTEPLAPPGGDTAVLTAPTTAPSPAAPPRERRWLVPAVLGALLVALLIAGLIALAREPAGDRQGRRTQTPAQQTDEPPPEGSAPPAVVVTDSVEEAVDQIESVVNAGLDAGTITEGAALDIRDRVQDALNHYIEGDMTGAIARIQETQEKVAELLGEGEIASEEWRAAIHETLDVLIDAMEANPTAPAEEEDEDAEGSGGEGPGNSEEQGKGKGKDKD